MTVEVKNVETEEVFEHGADDAARDNVVMDTKAGAIQSEPISYVSTFRLNISNDCKIYLSHINNIILHIRVSISSAVSTSWMTLICYPGHGVQAKDLFE